MLAVIGVPLLVIGLLAYTGRWRSWAAGGRHRYLLGLAWWGAGFCLIGLAAALPRGWAGLSGVIGVLLALIGAVGLFWLPKALTPRWFREEKRRSDGVRY